MKRFYLLMLFLSVCVFASSKNNIYKKGWIDFNKNGRKDIYEDTSKSVDERVADLLSQMTIDEKTCQMATLYGSGRVLKDKGPTEEWKNEIWKDGIGNIDEQANGLGKFGSDLSFPYSVSVKNKHDIQRWFVECTRLGIPVDFTNEGIRGICHDRATFFPAQCGQGATWDRQLISEISRVTAEEAKALGYTNVYSPILDIAQDPRWGRAVESYGENPYLVGELGLQMVRGLQSRGIASTPKHFAVYSIPVGGRDGATRTDPHVAPREMKTSYLEAFRKAFQVGGALGVMASYNDYDGVPIIGSHYFLSDILRGWMHFRGYVVSDSEAVEFLLTKHRVDSTKEDMVAQAVNAGLNVRTNFTPPSDFILPLRRAIEQGKISIDTLNSRVADILRVKFILGLFDNPYPGDGKVAEKIVNSQEHRNVSLRAALESMTLLKNDGNLLPLNKNIKNVAVIGPNADATSLLTSRYGPANAHVVSVYSAVKEMLPNAEVKYVKGCDINDKYFPKSELYEIALDEKEKAGIDSAVQVARSSDAVIMVLGGDDKTVREEYSRTSLNLMGRQEQLLRAVHSTGKPIVLVLIDGRAETINWAADSIPAIIHAWFPGEFTGTAVARTIFGENNPGGHLAVSFPKSVGQIPFAFPRKPGSDSPGHVRVAGDLFPFGFGLSYTTFEYSDLHISNNNILPSDSVVITCKVKNIGKMEGDEVPQLYIRDDYSSVTTYERDLRGFDRIALKPGGVKMVSFTLHPQELGLWDINNKFTVEPGQFTVMVGCSSKDIRLTGHFNVIK
jgi:beta-glucosidase